MVRKADFESVKSKNKKLALKETHDSVATPTHARGLTSLTGSATKDECVGRLRGILDLQLYDKSESGSSELKVKQQL